MGSASKLIQILHFRFFEVLSEDEECTEGKGFQFGKKLFKDIRFMSILGHFPHIFFQNISNMGSIVIYITFDWQ